MLGGLIETAAGLMFHLRFLQEEGVRAVVVVAVTELIAVLRKVDYLNILRQGWLVEMRVVG